MYKHVIWDFDGTLFDTYPSMVGALIDTLHKHGYEAVYEEALALMKRSAGEALQHYRDLYGYGDDFLAAYRERRKEIELALCEPYPGAREVLEGIVDRGGYNYIFTHRGGTLFGMLEKHGMSELFRECVTVRSGFARKPDPEGIDYLLEKYGIAREEAIMVGDRELDILSGKNAGIATCDYWDGTGPRLDSADFIVKDFAEMRSVLGL